MRKFIAFGPALVVLITALVTLVAAPAAVRLIGYATTDAQIQLARHDLAQDNILKQMDKAVRNIADAVEPSVVHIGVEQPTEFGGVVRTAQGSGWVFDTQGHIVTNSHVVRGARRIMVQFNDGRAADAQVVGQDAQTDIAVIKVVTTEGLFPAQRGTGIELHQGDRVYAFGSPFGFKFSMSEGIISGLGRDPQQIINNHEGYTNFIQTDAAVNPGNSGGPLVNVEGKVVGMNVAIATAVRPNRSPGTRSQPNPSEEGQNSGISFAIPLTTIDRVVEQIVSGGVVTRGYLGIGRPEDDEQNQAILNTLGFHGRGVAVTNIECNAPAEKSGLAVNDVITKLDHIAVAGVPALRSVIANKSPGDRVSVEVWRAGEQKVLEVELGRMNSVTDLQEAAVAANRFGISDIGETRGKQVFVTDVRVPSPAFDAGVRPNSRVVDIGGCPVRGTEGFFNAIASRGIHKGAEFTMTLQARDGKSMTIQVSGK